MKSIKRILAMTLTLVMVFTLLGGSLSVSAADVVTCTSELFVVDDDFAGLAAGTAVSATVAGTTYKGKLGSTAFATIQEAYVKAVASGEIYVAAGIYTGKLEIDKITLLYGNNKGISPNSVQDISVASAERGATGTNETILQDMQISYRKKDLTENISGATSVTMDGFAITGDSCLFFADDRLSASRFTICNNVFDLVNDTAYNAMGVIGEDSFAAVRIGKKDGSNFLPGLVTFENNRVERVTYAGNGMTKTAAFTSMYSESYSVKDNYIANVTDEGIAISRLGTSGTTVSGNYVKNVGLNRIYDGIRGAIYVSGNTFDGITGEYALGVYATGSDNNYNVTWYESTNIVQIDANIFKNTKKAIMLYGRLRQSDNPLNAGPVGSTIFDNKYYTDGITDPTFVHMRFSTGVYAPPLYNNYTGSYNPKDICLIDNSDAGANFDYGTYWLDEDMTEPSTVLDIKAITNSNGFSFNGAAIKAAPIATIAAAVPHTLSEITIALEPQEGAFYTLYKDKECTQPITDNTVALQTGVASNVYAKVVYRDYSLVHTITLTSKVAYSEYLDANEYIVDPAFAQYPAGQTVYAQIGGVWKRAVVQHSAFTDIANAIDKAAAGSIINVAAGEFTLPSILKGVTIKGAMAGINPNEMDGSTYGRNPVRDNLANETRLIGEMYMYAGTNGFTLDGVTMTQMCKIMFSGQFHIDGLTIKNTLVTGSKNADSVLQQGRNDNNKQTKTNFLFQNNRCEGAGSSYVMRLPNVASGLFEGNVFTDCNKTIYMGGTDGTANDVLEFRGNVFQNCANGFLTIGDGSLESNAGARVKNSIKLTDNIVTGSSSGNLLALKRWTSGNILTVTGNRFESGRCNISVDPQPGFSGQTIEVHENYYATGTFANNTSSVANCSYNYAKAGMKTTFSGECITVPYYTDAEMTKLAGAYQIDSVVSPAGATFNNEEKTIDYTGTAAVDFIDLSIKVSEGATYELFSDAACKKLIKDNKLYLKGVATTAYVRITAEDGVTSDVYTLTVNQPESSNAELLGMDIEGAVVTEIGAGKYNCYLPNSYVVGPLVPQTSAGASAQMFATDDTEFKTPILYSSDMNISVGNTSYIYKVTSEDGSASGTYTVTFIRQHSTKAELLDVADAIEDVEITGTVVNATFGNETLSLLPVLTVSDGATYDLYQDIGCNIYLEEAIALEVGVNTVYAKITAEDGTTETVYALNIVREDKSSAKNVLADSFPTYAASEADLTNDATGTLVGLKRIDNNARKIYLQPKEYIEKLEDALLVSEGASYDIYTKYDATTGDISGKVSGSTEKKDLKLVEGINTFYVRVNALNGSTAIYEMQIINAIKNTECEITDIYGFTVLREGNVITAVGETDNPQVDIFLSDKATAKVYADRKKTVEVASTMGVYTITETQVSHTDCKLNAPMSKTYQVYFVEVTSQTGAVADYELRLQSGMYSRTFDDIEGHWARDYIVKGYQMGITSGAANSDGTFSFNPQSNATRQEVAVFVTNLLGIDTACYNKGALPYKDAKSIASWAKNAVRAVTALGIMGGDGTNFNPKSNISREEFMAVMVRAAALDTSKGTASKLNKFVDKSAVSSWAKTYVATAVAYNLVGGDEKGRLNPRNPITRAELIKIMVCAEDYVR